MVLPKTIGLQRSFTPDYDELPEAYQPELAYGVRTGLDRLSVNLSTIHTVFSGVIFLYFLNANWEE